MVNIKQFDNTKHLLKHDDIDRLHTEFLEIYNSADVNSIESLKSCLIRLLEHTKKHFEYEEIQMDEYGYPTKREHKDEHEKVLAEMQYFINLSKSKFGQKMLKAYYIEKIPSWFDLHLISMDSDLTHFLNTKGK